MAKSIPVSATKSYLIDIRNTLIKGVTLAGAAATSVFEVFDGGIDAFDTHVIIDGGSGYAVGDYVTLATGENGSVSGRAVFRVTQIDDHSASSSVSSSPSTSASSSVSSSTSPSASLSPSASASSSASSSVSPSSSASSSASSSVSPSTSVSSSPSPSVSASSSVSPSTSVSSSPSTSVSSSPSTSASSSVSSSASSSSSSSASSSLSPSVGAGRMTLVELITAGGGYTAGNTYDVATTTGSGVGGSIKAVTVTDANATSVAKLQCVANESAPPLTIECGMSTTKGISVRISGASAKGHVIYE